MKIIYLILFTLLFICSCDLFNKIKGNNKVNLEIQSDVQNTPETSLRKNLSESQNKGLDFLKKVLKGNDYKLNDILNVSGDKLGKLKEVLDNIQRSLANCRDSRSSSYSTDDGHDPNTQREGFKSLVLSYVEEQLGSQGSDSEYGSPPNPLNGDVCVDQY
ncbi:hypothetical protein bcCo53_001435 (plasmid) [Borrelia coriaceae]|uniref:Lipoprotein n=1 Tax=Borrelia coriaceae ATCC 43381 TaxID=1408429 RepID=W5SWM4_9SPIR|nr:Mlp family lipoprotein [Borrelia coriaceae]AHH11599.1 Lipoprotein [Borrelia coriaceae ATCC 43381]UPA17257.1 hypothetical protein bcCo53_001435 [Borrelia coriaceae]